MDQERLDRIGDRAKKVWEFGNEAYRFFNKSPRKNRLPQKRNRPIEKTGDSVMPSTKRRRTSRRVSAPRKRTKTSRTYRKSSRTRFKRTHRLRRRLRTRRSIESQCFLPCAVYRRKGVKTLLKKLGDDHYTRCGLAWSSWSNANNPTDKNVANMSNCSAVMTIVGPFVEWGLIAKWGWLRDHADYDKYTLPTYASVWKPKTPAEPLWEAGMTRWGMLGWGSTFPNFSKFLLQYINYKMVFEQSGDFCNIRICIAKLRKNMEPINGGPLLDWNKDIDEPINKKIFKVLYCKYLKFDKPGVTTISKRIVNIRLKFNRVLESRTGIAAVTPEDYNRLVPDEMRSFLFIDSDDSNGTNAVKMKMYITWRWFEIE